MTKEVPRTSVLWDAELNKTLIERLRGVWRYKDLHLCPEAADRIELLATTNEQLVATNEALTAKLATCEKYRDAYAEMGRIGTQAVRDLEAKMAIAVMEAFKEGFAAGAADGWQNNPRILNEWKRSKAFAEIKSGVATTPYGLEGENHE